ncbi:hypothetical protein H6F51_08120 [Cyanobacteria bacterium FACHB-DQ100]|nr:hypothetical protein [Cyanobacteria bacterium FACHB-DQ100]
MNKIPTTSQTSLSEGLWFIFQDSNKRIAAHVSWFTGQECVFANDNLISKRRSLSMTSTHRFIFEEDTYEVVFSQSILSSDVKCSLIKNGICIERLKVYFPSETFEFSFIVLFCYFALGVLIPFFRLPIWLLLLAVFCSVVVVGIDRMKKAVIDKTDI